MENHDNSEQDISNRDQVFLEEIFYPISPSLSQTVDLIMQLITFLGAVALVEAAPRAGRNHFHDRRTQNSIHVRHNGRAHYAQQRPAAIHQVVDPSTSTSASLPATTVINPLEFFPPGAVPQPSTTAVNPLEGGGIAGSVTLVNPLEFYTGPVEATTAIINPLEFPGGAAVGQSGTVVVVNPLEFSTRPTDGVTVVNPLASASTTAPSASSSALETLTSTPTPTPAPVTVLVNPLETLARPTGSTTILNPLEFYPVPSTLSGCEASVSIITLTQTVNITISVTETALSTTTEPCSASVHPTTTTLAPFFFAPIQIGFTGSTPSTSTLTPTSPSTNTVLLTLSRALATPTEIVIDPSLSPVLTAPSSAVALAAIPSTVTVKPSTTVFELTAPTGRPQPANIHCGIHGNPVGNFFLARFVENEAGTPVTLEGCWQFGGSIYGMAHGCLSYNFYTNELGAARCDLYGSRVAFAVDEIDGRLEETRWFDLACGDPVLEGWRFTSTTTASDSTTSITASASASSSSTSTAVTTTTTSISTAIVVSVLPL
ncbi:hypothetical protein QBC35DRAFT_458457 [Podospora australis]|uniref:Uncharacterized protein n=1 Tax=Podospora australis TaxID=1536484 RepID=A0AAN6X3X8_9PEZI|nr:hypothetical protein QBC35DRAFT_458457 [Podospora australis]